MHKFIHNIAKWYVKWPQFGWYLRTNKVEGMYWYNTSRVLLCTCDVHPPTFLVAVSRIHDHLLLNQSVITGYIIMSFYILAN